MFNFPRI